MQQQKKQNKTKQNKTKGLQVLDSSVSLEVTFFLGGGGTSDCPSICLLLSSFRSSLVLSLMEQLLIIAKGGLIWGCGSPDPHPQDGPLPSYQNSVCQLRTKQDSFLITKARSEGEPGRGNLHETNQFCS